MATITMSAPNFLGGFTTSFVDGGGATFVYTADGSGKIANVLDTHVIPLRRAGCDILSFVGNSFGSTFGTCGQNR
jgi:hypothetical protein